MNSQGENGNPLVSARPAKERNLWTVLGFLGLALFFLALRWNSVDAPLTRDEGEYAYSAWLLNQGIAPYQNTFLQKPPMVVYSYGLAELVAPHLNWFPRVLGGAFVALATLLLGAVARREFGKGCAMAAMWLATPMILLPQVEQFTANTEMFLLLPLMGCVVIYVYTRERNCRWHWFAAGGLTALTLLYKFTVFPVLLLVLAAWSYESGKAGGWAPLAKRWLFWIAGAGLASAIALAVFLKTGGGRSLWECVIRFNRYYSGSSGFGLPALSYRWGTFWSAWWPLVLLLLVFLARRPPRLWFWLAMTVAAFGASFGSWYGHYYVPAMLFWALLCAAAIKVITSAIPPHWPISPAAIRRSAVAVILVVICLADASALTLTKRQFQTQVYPFRESVVTAEHLAQITSPTDRVFVAGSEPQILYYARRLSSTRFDIMYPLMVPTPLAEGYQREAIRELEERPPAAIVCARSNRSWLRGPASPTLFQAWLAGRLKDDYQLVGGYLEGEGGSWQEPLAAAQIEKCSLLLYRLSDREAEPERNDARSTNTNAVLPARP